MTKNNNIVKRLMAVLFVAILFVGFTKNGSYVALTSLSNYLSQYDFDSAEATTVSSIESTYTAAIPNQKDLINLNGRMANFLNIQGFYSNMGIYVTDDKYIVSAYSSTTTDYEYNETIDFRNFLSENGINFLYVNEPTKYIDDDMLKTEFGVETHINENADLFLSRIRDAGISTIDLRDNIVQEDKNIYDMFFKTDHHWTPQTGLWATQIIADGLNTYCGYDIDTTIYNEENYTLTEWKNCWLGEQGKLIAKTYVGLDDYTEVKPNFETSFTFMNEDGTTCKGTFDNFVDESVYNLETDVYENGSWHYSYLIKNSFNNNVSDGKVLLIGDSYEHVVFPFLALGVHEIDFLVLRSCDESFNLRNYILENGYDTVVVAYAQFMIGAHDSESSANYRMFTFR